MITPCNKTIECKKTFTAKCVFITVETINPLSFEMTVFLREASLIFHTSKVLFQNIAQVDYGKA